MQIELSGVRITYDASEHVTVLVLSNTPEVPESVMDQAEDALDEFTSPEEER